MDVASPIESRIAGRAAASGTLFTPFIARTSISVTLATTGKRDWRSTVVAPTAFGSFAPLAIEADAIGIDSATGDASDARGGRHARYRYRHRPSATGEGRAS